MKQKPKNSDKNKGEKEEGGGDNQTEKGVKGNKKIETQKNVRKG
jgi:hypothetical protein